MKVRSQQGLVKRHDLAIHRTWSGSKRFPIVMMSITFRSGSMGEWVENPSSISILRLMGLRYWVMVRTSHAEKECRRARVASWRPRKRTAGVAPGNCHGVTRATLEPLCHHIEGVSVVRGKTLFAADERQAKARALATKNLAERSTQSTKTRSTCPGPQSTAIQSDIRSVLIERPKGQNQ